MNFLKFTCLLLILNATQTNAKKNYLKFRTWGNDQCNVELPADIQQEIGDMPKELRAREMTEKQIDDWCKVDRFFFPSMIMDQKINILSNGECLTLTKYFDIYATVLKDFFLSLPPEKQQEIAEKHKDIDEAIEMMINNYENKVFVKASWKGFCPVEGNDSGDENDGNQNDDDDEDDDENEVVDVHNNSGTNTGGGNVGNNSGNNNASINDTFQTTNSEPKKSKYVKMKLYIDNKCSSEFRMAGMNVPTKYGFTEKGIEKWCVNENKLQDPAKKMFDGEKISNGECIASGKIPLGDDGIPVHGVYYKLSWSGFCGNTSGKSKSFPWWAILLIVVGAVALIGGIGCCICKNKKTSGGNKKSGCHV